MKTIEKFRDFNIKNKDWDDKEMKKVFVAGGASYNSIIRLEQFPEPIAQTIKECEFNETLGSTGIGKALNINKLGFDITLHAFIGNDIYGEKIKEYLNKEKMNFIYDLDDSGTERHVNLMDKNGERISIFVNKATHDPEVNIAKFTNYIKESDYVVLNIVNYVKKLIPLCKEYNKEIWTDLHDYDGKSQYHEDFIEAADYIFMSSNNLQDYRQTMMEFHKMGKKLVVCTHGNKGATVLTNGGNWIETPILAKYNMVDTNGAGDSFFSGFLYGFSKGYTVEKCMKLGAICGGLSITSEELVYEELSEDLLEKEYAGIR